LVRQQSFRPNFSMSSAFSLGRLRGTTSRPQQIVFGETDQPGHVAVWQMTQAQERFRQASSWYGFGEQFSGGITIAEP
jgi:hypothetical protein